MIVVGSCFFVFVGFDVIGMVSEEVINFKWLVLLFIMLIFGISFLVYFGVVIVLMFMMFYDKLSWFVVLVEVFV